MCNLDVMAAVCGASCCLVDVQERAFLGLCTLRDLVMKRTRGTDDFMQALLEVTMNDLELVCAIRYIECCGDVIMM